jgi:hypothetical protein
MKCVLVGGASGLRSQSYFGGVGSSSDTAAAYENTKHEIRNSKQIRNSNFQTNNSVLNFGHLVIRISDLASESAWF